jgi:16S rRNA (cytidine1402-2'-O)-methyltransferase
MAGTLFVVATPIGNLEDLTFRALRTLRDVDLIAAEDTRRTAKLLAHYEVRKPLVSLREHNEVRETPRLIARLEAGESIALVSDAGTPGIADPGARLVRAVDD